jgi:CHASE2 domain-containing sensor protein
MNSYLKKIAHTTIVLVITILLAGITENFLKIWFFKLIFPESLALEDVYWEDFAAKLKTDTQPDNRIVIFDLGERNRMEVADQLNKISKYRPKVIGIDAFFNCPPGKIDSINCPRRFDIQSNKLLEEAIRNAGNVVLVSSSHYKKGSGVSSQFDSLELSDEQFIKHAEYGHANLILHGQFRESADNGRPLGEVREFEPFELVNGEKIYSFSAQIARKYDSTAFEYLVKRKKKSEWINFRGSINSYHYQIGDYSLSKSVIYQFANIDSLERKGIADEFLRNKIVILGFIGNNLLDPTYSDRFYTPLNTTFAGKSLPDMLGLEIHANIVSMILDKSYINEIRLNWLQLDILTLIIILSNIILFTWLHSKNTVWYDSLCFIIPVTQIILFSWLRLELLMKGNLRLDTEGIIIGLAFISLAVNLYYGPLTKMRMILFQSINKLR